MMKKNEKNQPRFNTPPTDQYGVLVIGAGGHARVLLDAAELCGLRILGIIDVRYSGQEESILGYSVLGGLELLPRYGTTGTKVVFALGTGREREQFEQAARIAGLEPLTLVHPKACVSPHCTLAAGAFIAAGAVICAAAQIGRQTIVNTSAVVDHETIVGEFSHVAVGANLAGRVQIGKRTLIGIGTVVLPGVSVGDDAVVGAGAVVVKDVPAGVTVVGVPAR
jgi:sugar O-acyltransferase (sialic acid O-acetyltransferase NeuD family)